MKAITLILPKGIVLLLLLSLSTPNTSFSFTAHPAQVATKKEYQSRFAAAETQYRLGHYPEAIRLFRECKDHFKDSQAERYLQSIHYLGLSYFKNGDYGYATLASLLGTAECRNLGKPRYSANFQQLLGLTTYADKRPEQAVVQLKNALPYFEKRKDYANAALTSFYIAKCYQALGQEANAIAYFAKVAALFKEHHYTHPDLREAFDTLIGYHGQRDEEQQQLVYVNQLLQADALMNKQYPYLFARINKQYDTEELVQLQRENSNSATALLAVLGLLALSIIFLSYWYYRRWKAEAIALESIPAMNAIYDEGAKIVTIEISPEVENAILKRLEKFEQDKKFLQPDLSLPKLSQLLDSNARYVSAIIAKHRNKRIIEYINDLKVDHMILLFHQDPKYRSYNHKGMAEEVGFVRGRHFASAFQYRTGISVGDYLDKIK